MKNKTKTRPHESAIIENNFHHANNKIFSHFTIEFCSSNIKLFFTTPFIKRQQVDITIISLIILWTIQCIVYTQRNRIWKKLLSHFGNGPLSPINYEDCYIFFERDCTTSRTLFIMCFSSWSVALDAYLKLCFTLLH